MFKGINIRSLLIIVTVFAVALSAVNKNVSYLKNILKNFDSLPSSRNITLYEKRFSGVKKILPANSIVSYVSDKSQPDNMNYFLTQFALNPVIVSNKIDNNLVIGDFKSKNYQEMCRKSDFKIVKDFGDGAVLLRKRVK